jgi:hypothetical protein
MNGANHCIFHPNDPGAPENDSDDTTAESIADVRCFLGVAELAAKRGELDKAREALREARFSIDELLGSEE